MVYEPYGSFGYIPNLPFLISGILMYRMFRNERKRKLKLLHAGIMIAVFFLTVIALKAVFDSHNLKPCAKPSEEGDFCPIPNLYSLHSWMGLITVILFLFQVSATPGAKIHILSKNSHFENPNFYKSHLSEISFFTKVTFLKSQYRRAY